MKAASIGTDAIRRYVEHRQQPEKRVYTNKRGKKREGVYGPAANGTINRELALLRRAFKLGRMATPPKCVPAPHFRLLAENNARKGFFEHEAFLAVRRELPEEIRPVITFAYFTGCRKGEIVKLRWSQVDLAERIVGLEPGETKNDEARTIPLVADLYEMLKLQRETRDEYFPECGGEIRFHRQDSQTPLQPARVRRAGRPVVGGVDRCRAPLDRRGPGGEWPPQLHHHARPGGR